MSDVRIMIFIILMLICVVISAVLGVMIYILLKMKYLSENMELYRSVITLEMDRIRTLIGKIRRGMKKDESEKLHTTGLISDKTDEAN